MSLLKSLVPALVVGTLLVSCGGDPSRPINQPDGNNQQDNDRVTGAPKKSEQDIFCDSTDAFVFESALINGVVVNNDPVDTASVSQINLAFNAVVGDLTMDSITLVGGSKPVKFSASPDKKNISIEVESKLDFNSTYTISIADTVAAKCPTSRPLNDSVTIRFITSEDPNANPDAPVVTFVGLASGETEGTDEDRIRVSFNEAVKLNEKALTAFFPTKNGEIEVDISKDNTETNGDTEFNSVYNRPIARESDDSDGVLRLVLDPDLIEDEEMNTAALQTQPTAVQQTTEIILNKPSVITSVFGEQDLAGAERALLDQPDNLAIDIQLDRPLARKVSQIDGSCEFNSSAFTVAGLTAEQIITSYPLLRKVDSSDDESSESESVEEDTSSESMNDASEAEEPTLCDTSVVLVSFVDIELNEADEQYTLSIDGSKLKDEFGATTDMGVFDSGRIADSSEMSEQDDSSNDSNTDSAENDPASDTAEIKFSITDSVAPIALRKINVGLSDKTEVDLISSMILVDGVDPRTAFKLDFNRQIKIAAGTADQENQVIALLDSQPIDAIDCVAESEGAVALTLEPAVNAEAGVAFTIPSSSTLDAKTVFEVCSLTGLIEPKDALEGDQVDLSSLMPTFPLLFETGEVAPTVTISIDNPEVAQSTDEPLVITIADYDGADESLCSEITVVNTEDASNIEGTFLSSNTDDNQLICTFEPTSKLILSDLNNLPMIDFDTGPGTTLQPITQKRLPRGTEILVTVPAGKFVNVNSLSNEEVTSEFTTKNEIFLNLNGNSITLAIADGVDPVPMTPEIRLVGPGGFEQDLSLNALVEALDTCFPDVFEMSSVSSNCIINGLSETPAL